MPQPPTWVHRHRNEWCSRKWRVLKRSEHSSCVFFFPLPFPLRVSVDTLRTVEGSEVVEHCCAAIWALGNTKTVLSKKIIKIEYSYHSKTVQENHLTATMYCPTWLRLSYPIRSLGLFRIDLSSKDSPRKPLRRRPLVADALHIQKPFGISFLLWNRSPSAD